MSSVRGQPGSPDRPLFDPGAVDGRDALRPDAFRRAAARRRGQGSKTAGGGDPKGRPDGAEHGGTTRSISARLIDSTVITQNPQAHALDKSERDISNGEDGDLLMSVYRPASPIEGYGTSQKSIKPATMLMAIADSGIAERDK